MLKGNQCNEGLDGLRSGTALRILMLCYEYPPLGGGGGRAVDGLARALVALGHAVDLVTMGFRGQPAREVVQGVKVHRVPCFRSQKHTCRLDEAASYLLPALVKAHGLAAGSRYDITHGHFLLPDGLIAELLRRLRGLPYIITTHGSDVPGYNPHRLKRSHCLVRPLWQRVAQGAACVICPSEALQSLFAACCPEVDTVSIPYGFDSARFDPEDQPRKRRILVVTRMLERKGVQYLLDAVRDLDLGHEIHIVGDGPYLNELKALARGARPRIVFYGWLDNDSEQLRELYRSSQIFVLASEVENFPVSLLEAMAARLAIVTTRGTGCQEVVGDAAALVAPRDRDALRAAVLRLTADPEHTCRLGAAARRRLEVLFGWRPIAKRYVDLYRRFGARGTAIPSPQYETRQDRTTAA
jgi:glycosyltransferase involved in cell wall biosynthesis